VFTHVFVRVFLMIGQQYQPLINLKPVAQSHVSALCSRNTSYKFAALTVQSVVPLEPSHLADASTKR
jgi:hypothetical protein